MQHLDDNAASEFVSGALPASAVSRIESHLARCRDCRALVAALAVDGAEDSSMATLVHERFTASQLLSLKPGLTVGDRVGRYLVLSSIGSGGMGVVFAAYDPQLDRKVALKLLRSGRAGSSKDARARLRREAQAIAQLNHPNVVSVYDVGTTEVGDLYIAMEFVEGDTLTSWLKSYPRSWREIIDVFVQAARGLHAAHSVGLLHRDFKPDNVLVGGDGRVRVTDFGLARSLLVPPSSPDFSRSGRASSIAALNSTLTATGTVLGTPRYMPPEQFTGSDLDARSDQFSFCVALYEALYGVHPMREEGTSASMLERGDKAKPPPDGNKIPVAIGRAVLRGLERDRVKRYPTMSSLIDQLGASPRIPYARYAAIGLGGLVLVSGLIAVLFVRTPTETPIPEQNPEVVKLTHDLQNAKREVEALLNEVQRTRAEHAEEVVRLHNAVREKNEQILEIAEKLRVAESALDRRPRGSKPIDQLNRVVDALTAAKPPIRGCFHEWAERPAGSGDDRRTATLVVGLTVSPNGAPTMGMIVDTPDDPADRPDGSARGRSALEFCVTDAIARVPFPSGPKELALEAVVTWKRGDVIVNARLTGHREVQGGLIEMH